MPDCNYETRIYIIKSFVNLILPKYKSHILEKAGIVLKNRVRLSWTLLQQRKERQLSDWLPLKGGLSLHFWNTI